MAHHSKCLLNHFTVKWNSFLEKKGKLSKMYAFIQRYRVHNTWNIKCNEKNGEILPSRESRVQCLPDPCMYWSKDNMNEMASFRWMVPGQTCWPDTGPLGFILESLDLMSTLLSRNERWNWWRKSCNVEWRCFVLSEADGSLMV